MKKYLLLLLTLFAIAVPSLSVSAKEPQIIINGNNTPLSGKAYIINDRTYVPMRELFENIGANVTWDDKTKSATATFKNTALSFKIDSNTVVKNGESFWSDDQCKLINEKTYIPIRIMLELLGFDVNWNENNQNVEISSPSTENSDNNSDNSADNTQTEITTNNEYEIKVLELINKERKNNGLNSLVLDEDLSHVARAHSEDMYKRNFFSHTNPDGMSPFDRMDNYGISYMSAGENIAAGQPTPEAVVNAWMNSEGHRKNILSPDFQKIGVGYFYSGKNYAHYWTQCFTD